MQKNFENRVDLFDKLKKLGLSDFGELTEISNQGQKKRWQFKCEAIRKLCLLICQIGIIGNSNYTRLRQI